MRKKSKRGAKPVASRPWRQVRIFIKDVHFYQAYLDLLGYLVKPLAQAYPAAPLFISRYGPLAMHQDRADTQFDNLPDPFKLDFLGNGGQQHLSLRLRFAATRREEDFIVQKLNNCRQTYWYSDIREYEGVPGFGEGRAYPGANPDEQRVRAELVGQVLCAHTRFVLETLKQENGVWVFETNPNVPAAETSHTFCPHMIFNIIGNKNGSGFATQIGGVNSQGIPWHGTI